MKHFRCCSSLSFFFCLLLQTTTAAQPAAHRNLDYGGKGNKRQLLDLYLPAKVKHPLLVVWIHGGAWWGGGSKEHCEIRWLTKSGYAVASINYRLSQEAIFPAQIHDCKAAIRWLRARAKKYGYRSQHIGVAGASAGGHLAALLGTTTGVKRLEGDIGNHAGQSSAVQAVVDLFGPTDFLQMDAHAIPGSPIIHDSARSPESRLIGGPIQQNKNKATAANPIHYVNQDAPPFLIIHGDKDKLVPVHQSLLLARALKKSCRTVRLTVLPGAGHGGRRFRQLSTRRLILQFLNAHLK